MKEKVFVNRTLNLKKIKYIGFDMDHTIIRYNSENFESLVYKFVVDYLIANKHYPNMLKDLIFNFDSAIRGSVVDSNNGNILKLSRYGAIRQSYHGIWPIKFNEQKQIYRSTYVDLNDPNYIAIDTSFSIAFCVLFGQLVDLKDKNPQLLPSYEMIAFDILYSVDKIHAEGELKKYICEHLSEYVIHDPEVVTGLIKFKENNKKLFVLTNSDYQYTKLMLDYVINPYLPDGETWQSLFEFAVTYSNKPRFFYDNLKFLNVNPEDGSMTNLNGPVVPGIYQGGNAKKFTDDLSLSGDEILYIGDHIYGDILRLKKDCNWRTALVVEELGSEIAAQEKSQPIEKKIVVAMDTKKELEQQHIIAQTKLLQTNDDKYELEAKKIHDEIVDIDNKVAALLKEQRSFFNPTWGRIFRAGAEESYFAYQVERYACIYMEKLSDLLELSPLTYFRADRRRLAHD
jgi:HAD superfamily 5'-nucleotidase-like hydrolase